jgi:ComF family protein
MNRPDSSAIAHQASSSGPGSDWILALVRPFLGLRGPRVLGGLCQICRTWQGQALCTECVERFAAPRLRCRRCALGLAEPGRRAAADGACADEPAPAADQAVPSGPPRLLCAQCLHEPPPQQASVAAFDYVYPWAGLLARLKFNDALELSGPLAQALAVAVQGAQDAALVRVGLVLPVPLAPQRLRERGYNQAWELARRVARLQGLPAQARLLERLRETPHQIDLPRQARAANVRAAFVLAPGAAGQIGGRHVALVDDVMTTGATLTEATHTLLRGGAASVQCWVVARTPRDMDVE